MLPVFRVYKTEPLFTILHSGWCQGEKTESLFRNQDSWAESLLFLRPKMLTVPHHTGVWDDQQPQRFFRTEQGNHFWVQQRRLCGGTKEEEEGILPKDVLRELLCAHRGARQGDGYVIDGRAGHI